MTENKSVLYFQKKRPLFFIEIMAKGKLIIIEISIINKPFLVQNIFLCSFTNIGIIKNQIIVINSPPSPPFILVTRVLKLVAIEQLILAVRDINNKVTGLYSLSLYSLK